VNNVGDVWESDLADMGSLASQNDGHRYILNRIDAFCKCLCLVPNFFKTCEAVASDFRTILPRNGGRRLLALGGDKDKKFVNSRFRKLLNDEGIEIRVCKNPDVNCANVEFQQDAEI